MPLTPLRYALRLLSYRERSEKELEQRLEKRGFVGAEIRQCIDYLKEHGYIDDGAFARTLKRRAEEVKFLGLSGAKRYLRQMGIPAETAGEALAGFDELRAAGRLLEKKRKKAKDDPLIYGRRLLGLLRRRGFSPDTIRKIMRDMEVVR